MGKLQIILLLISIVFFFKIIRYIKKSKLTTDLAIIWILWGCGLIVISLFPSIVTFIANLLGIITTINALFLIMIFFLYCLVFYLFLKVSYLEDKLRKLAQYIAITESKKN